MTNLPMEIQHRRERILDMCPIEMSADAKERFYQIVLFEVQKNKELANCSPASVIEAALEASKLGLDFSGTTQQVHIVPFGKQATLIVGYRGLRDLMYKADPNIMDIRSYMVYSNDVISVDKDRGVDHQYQPFGDRGEKIGAYTEIRYVDGRPPYFEHMTKAEIELVQESSRAKNSPAWKNHPDEMWRKTTLRRAAKHTTLAPGFREQLSQLEANEEWDFEAVPNKPRSGVDATRELMQAAVHGDPPQAAEVAPGETNQPDPLSELFEELDASAGEMPRLEGDAP